MANPPDFRALERNTKSKALDFSSFKSISSRGAAGNVGNLPRPTPTNTPTPSITPTITPTPSVTPTYTPTTTPTVTPTTSVTPSFTPTITPTVTPSPVPLTQEETFTTGNTYFVGSDIVVYDVRQNFKFYYNQPSGFTTSGLSQTVTIYLDNILIGSFFSSTGRMGVNATNGGAFAISVNNGATKFYGNFSGEGSVNGTGLGAVYRFFSS